MMSAQVLPLALFLVSIFTKSFGFQQGRRLFRLAMSKDATKVLRTERRLANNQYRVDSLAFYHAMRNCKDTYIAKHINAALDVLTDAVRLYGVDNLLSSYNGGKDADVVMHLLRAVAAKYESDSGATYNPKLVYFAIEDEFPEVIKHLEFTKDLYDLDIKLYDCGINQVILNHCGAMPPIGAVLAQF